MAAVVAAANTVLVMQQIQQIAACNCPPSPDGCVFAAAMLVQGSYIQHECDCSHKSTHVTQNDVCRRCLIGMHCCRSDHTDGFCDYCFAWKLASGSTENVSALSLPPRFSWYAMYITLEPAALQAMQQFVQTAVRICCKGSF